MVIEPPGEACLLDRPLSLFRCPAERAAGRSLLLRAPLRSTASRGIPRACDPVDWGDLFTRAASGRGHPGQSWQLQPTRLVSQFLLAFFNLSVCSIPHPSHSHANHTIQLPFSVEDRQLSFRCDERLKRSEIVAKMSLVLGRVTRKAHSTRTGYLMDRGPFRSRLGTSYSSSNVTWTSFISVMSVMTIACVPLRSNTIPFTRTYLPTKGISFCL